MNVPVENEGKRHLASRFLSAYPPELFLFGLVEAALGKNPSKAEMAHLLSRLDEPGNREQLYEVCATALMSSMEEEELLFLADFYDSDMGRRVIPKLANFVSTATPGAMRLLGRMVSGVQ